jgi:hypothetical protein
MKGARCPRFVTPVAWTATGRKSEASRADDAVLRLLATDHGEALNLDLCVGMAKAVIVTSALPGKLSPNISRRICVKRSA